MRWARYTVLVLTPLGKGEGGTDSGGREGPTGELVRQAGRKGQRDAAVHRAAGAVAAGELQVARGGRAGAQRGERRQQRAGVPLVHLHLWQAQPAGKYQQARMVAPSPFLGPCMDKRDEWCTAPYAFIRVNNPFIAGLRCRSIAYDTPLMQVMRRMCWCGELCNCSLVV